MTVDTKQLQQGIADLLAKLRQHVTPGSPADHAVQVLASIEADPMVADLVGNAVNAVAKHLPDRLPGF